MSWFLSFSQRQPCNFIRQPAIVKRDFESSLTTQSPRSGVAQKELLIIHS